MSKISELSDGGSLVSSDYLIAVRSGGNVKVRMDQINVDQVDLGDNEFIRLGNSQDLTMVHNATNSIINQAGIGDLLIQKAGSTKLTINASGIDVTGSVQATGGNFTGQVQFNGTAGVQLDNGAQAHTWVLDDNFTSRFNIGTSSAGATWKFGSNNNAYLAVSPSGIDVTGTVTATGIIEASDATNGEMQFGLGTALTTGAGTYDSSVRWNGSAGNLLFSQGAVEKMRITSTGLDVTGSVTASNSLVIKGGALPVSTTGLFTVSGLSTGRLTSSGASKASSITSYYDDTYIEIVAGVSAGYMSGISIGGRSYAGTGGDAITFSPRGTAALTLAGATGAATFTGSVGIGASPPANKLHVKETNDGGTATVALFENAATLAASQSQILLVSGGNTDRGAAISSYNENVSGQPTSMIFSTSAAYSAPTERLRIDSSGHAIIPAGVTLGTAVGVYNAANTLDDYEEGTWTPEYAPSTGSFTTITYDGQTGHYVKVGALVTAWCYIRTASLDTTGASGNLLVTGFPFAADADSGTGTGSCSAQDQWTTQMPTITWVSSSTATLGYDGATSYVSIPISNMTTGASKNRMYAVWSYETTS